MALLQKDLRNIYIKVRELWQVSGIGVRPVALGDKIFSKCFIL